MRRVTARVSTVVLLLLSATALHAQQTSSSTVTTVPRLVRVTSVFAPANGLPAAAVETVTLAIYAEETGGTPLWQETQTVAVDADGRYTVLLGATQTDGLPLELFASGEARWLGRRFERSGEGEQARVLLASVPYALKASDADTLGGRPPSAYLLAEPAAKNDAHAPSATGSSKTSAAAAGESLMAGTVNFVGKFYNATDLGNSALYEIGGRVGVNTQAPADAMHVMLNDPNGAFTGFAVQNLSGGANAYSGMLFYDQIGALGQFQGFNNATHEYRINNIATGGSINFMIGSSSKLQVRSDGDVEIPGSLRKGGNRFLYTPLVGNNTFLGFNAGNVTMTGIQNTASGALALSNNTTGASNTATGDGALSSNTTGNSNMASGVFALALNTTGIGNVASGNAALLNTTTGNDNTANGGAALLNNSTGDFNVAVGYHAGLNATTGSNSIYLGANVMGVAGEANTMYLGAQGTQTKTVIAGVRGITTGVADAISVFIDSSGQLGTVNSSRRYKEDIQDMGEASSGLMHLRPVTYRYQQPYANGTKPIDYGLIAEEVEAVYPDFVTHLADGEVETVQYQKINAMLLNEVQKQHRQLQQQEETNRELAGRLAALEALLPSMVPSAATADSK